MAVIGTIYTSSGLWYANFVHTGGFSFNIQISKGLKFRIRAFGLQNGEKIWGEFSDWYSLEVE